MSSKVQAVILLIVSHWHVVGTAAAGEAHVHGRAGLNVAIDGGQVFIEFDSPAANLVGYEHAPGNDEQRASLRTAIATLHDPNAVFRFPASARCRMTRADVDSPWPAESQHEQSHHDRAERHGSAHREHGDHGHQDAPEDRHVHEDNDGHADFAAAYVFECANPRALEQIDIVLFDSFQRLERIDVQVIAADRQRAQRLTTSRTGLSLR